HKPAPPGFSAPVPAGATTPFRKRGGTVARAPEARVLPEIARAQVRRSSPHLKSRASEALGPPFRKSRQLRRSPVSEEEVVAEAPATAKAGPQASRRQRSALNSPRSTS